MERIYNQVANRYNTTADEVEREIAYAIAIARQSSSSVAKAFWGRIDDNANISEIICNIVSRLALVV